MFLQFLGAVHSYQTARKVAVITQSSFAGINSFPLLIYEEVVYQTYTHRRISLFIAVNRSFE